MTEAGFGGCTVPLGRQDSAAAFIEQAGEVNKHAADGFAPTAAFVVA